jgi:hypothetical protein
MLIWWKLICFVPAKSRVLLHQLNATTLLDIAEGGLVVGIKGFYGTVLIHNCKKSNKNAKKPQARREVNKEIKKHQRRSKTASRRTFQST